MNGKHKSREESEKAPGMDRSQTLLFIAFLGVFAGAYIWYLGTDQGEARWKNAVHISFVVAPDTIPIAVPSRFTIQVDNGTAQGPMSGRAVHVRVTPAENAQIISVTDPSGRETAAIAQEAWGHSDAQGSIAVQLRAMKAGKYTLAAGDSLASSAEGASIEFWAR